MKSSLSPVPKQKKQTINIVSEPDPYIITLTFNHQAQLTDVSKPDNLSTAKAIEHLAVGVQFLAMEAGK